MLQQLGTAKVVFPLADNVAELLEEVLQLLLLYGRQMFRYGWLAHRLGRGGRWLRISDGDHLQSAHILTRVQAERLWALIVDGYPHFGAAGKRGDSGYERWQSILGAEVDVFRGPRVVAVDESSGFSGDVGGLE